MLPYKKLTINCQTNGSIPPPYAHYYSIEVTQNASYLALSFNLQYTNREELSEEEILEEGFTSDDDFNWKGTLNKVWKNQLDFLLGETQLHPNPPSTSDYVVEIIRETDEAKLDGFISKKETQRWVYFIQELKQAILESEKIEAPLKIEYLSIQDRRETSVLLNGSFTERTFTVRVDNRPIETLDWNVLQRTINLIFNETDIEPEESLVKRPTEPGQYLLIPGSGWFQFGVGFKPRYDDNTILENITKMMKGFVAGK
jgi:hypothetical protein